MTTKRILALILAVTMVFGTSGKVLAADYTPEREIPTISQTEPILLTAEQLQELMELAPCFTETRSAEILANRQISENELNAWITEYWELGINAFELEVIKLINIERERYGLQPFLINPNLMMAARFHSQDMADMQFFSHTSPNHNRGINRAEMFGHENIQEHVWGVRENIARSTRNPNTVVQAWMNSPGHRAAILETTYLTIGVGAVQNGGTTAKFGS